MRHVASLVTLLLLLGSACAPSQRGTDGDADTDVDADTDSDADADGGDACPADAECCNDSDCSNGVFCDGVEVCDRGRCEPGPPLSCDDSVACTLDECDEARNLCVHQPQHGECDDDDVCSGEERCEPASEDADERGCLAGSPLRCDDGDPCTDDFCQDGACQVGVRDSDGDGHGDYDCAICDPEDPTDCVRGDDCNDANADTYPGATEICDDGEDNNCDRWTDYADPTCSVPNDGCAAALELTPGDLVYSSTRGTVGDIDDGCGAAGDGDVVFFFVLAAESDVEVTVAARGARELFLSVTSACGAPESASVCESGRDFTLLRRAMAPGAYYLVASASAETDFSIELDTSAPDPGPPGDHCGTALALPGDGTTTAADLAGTRQDYRASCWRDAHMYDVMYELTVPSEQSGLFTVESATGAGRVGLVLMETCGLSTTERGCWSGDGTATGRAWRLPPGTYSVVVASEAAAEVDVTATLAPPEEGVYLLEDFSTSPAGWVLAGQWGYGTPAGSEPVPDDGPCIAGHMGGTYTNYMTYTADYAETPVFSLRSAAAPVLDFRGWMQFESCCDGGHVEISVDGGAWAVLEPSGMTPAYTSTIGGQRAWNTTIGAWGSYSFPLSAYVGHDVQLRFATYSDLSVVYQGWYVDNVMVHEP